MNAILSSQSLLDVSRAITELAMNWFLQSSLLIVAGLMIGYLLRSRGSAVQSAVYRTTLVAAILCPLASWLLSLAGATGWSVAMPAAYEVVATGGSPVAEVVGDLPDTTIDSLPNLSPLFDLSAVSDSAFAPTGESPVAAPNLEQSPIVQVEANLSPAAMPAELATVEPPVATESEFRVRSFGIVAIAFSAIWVMVTAVMLIRLALAWYGMAKLRRTACRSTTATLQLCDELATRMNVHAPDVLHSPYLPSPCLTGLRRPAVLLPDDDLHLPVRDVLIHELAHLARHDCHWNLLRRAAIALFFFQPLLWKLSLRLEASAEEVCDDYVVSYGGDRHDYAYRLVELAELSTASIAAAGVGIVSLRSMLARRVARIMDASRSLSTRVGHALLALVLIGGLLATMLAGLVGIGPRTDAAETEPTAVEASTIEDRSSIEKAAPKDDGAFTVRGQVLDNDGAPVANAHIIATQTRWIDSRFVQNEQRQVGEVRSAADGTFAIKVPWIEKPDYGVNRLGYFTFWKPPVISATAPGHTAAWIGGGEWGPDHPLMNDVTLRLHKQPVPIRGRLVNLEGQPLANLTVQVNVLVTSESGKVDAWLATVEQMRKEGKLPRPSDITASLFSAAMVMDAKSAAAERQNAYFPLATVVFPNHPNFPAAMQTDPRGRFEISGLPPDCLAVLEISGPGAATQSVSAVTRKMDRIDVPGTGMIIGNDSNGYYGAEFDYPVAPGATVVGTVKDAESGQPIEGVQVRSTVVVNRMASNRTKWASMTDADGEFRIDGLPAGSENHLDILPRLEQPYLKAEGIKTLPASGDEPTTIDVKLRRGVLVSGKVTDAKTGEPVDATIHYHPLLTNENAKNYGYDPQTFRYDEGERYRTGDDGSFQAVVIPGRGILGVQAVKRGAYCVGLGSDKIAIQEDGRFAVYDMAMPKLFNRVVEIDIPADAAEVKQDFAISRGMSVKLRMQDPQGKPLPGVHASGLTPFSFPGKEEAEDALLEFKALYPGETRRVLLMHKERRLGRIELVIAPKNGEAEVRTVTLEPCATVTGRVVDGEGEPVAGQQFDAHALPVRDLDVVTPQAVSTDAAGKFQFDYLPAGATYRIGNYNQKLGYIELAKELEFEPGESIDLGTIDATSKERPEPVRTKGATIASVDFRTLQFPVDAPLGMIYTRPAAGHEFKIGHNWYADWQQVGPAQGEVRVKQGDQVRLDISKAASTDLRALAQLHPDDIDALWLRNTDVTDEGLRYVGHLTGLRLLDLEHTRITDRGIEYLSNLKELRRIGLSAFSVEREGFGVGDEAMKVLAKLPVLDSVDLRLTKVSDEGLKHLATIQSLRSLSVEGTRVTDKGITHLVNLPQLQYLSLGVYEDGTTITDEGLKTIGQLKSLKSLRLNATQITDDGLVHLVGLDTLEDLSIDNTQITNRGLGVLAELPALKSLRAYSLSDGDINDEGAKLLSGVKSLEKLSAQLAISDIGLNHLATLPKLKELHLDDDRFTDAAIGNLSEMKSLDTLWLQHYPTTDATLAEIAKLERLTHLLINHAQMTDEGLQHLEALTKLKSLSLSLENPTEADTKSLTLESIGRMKSLTSLDFSGAGISNTVFANIANLPQLERLGARVMVDDIAAQHIAKLGTLSNLEIGDSVITDTGVIELGKLTNLEYLDLPCLATDDGLTPLANLKLLHLLQISSPHITDEGVAKLAAKMPSLSRVIHSSYRSSGSEVTLSKKDSIWRQGKPDERGEIDALEDLPPPPLTVENWINTENQPLDLKALHGKVVLVDFWGTWCGPCRASMPELKRLHEKYKDQGLEIVGVHTTSEADKMAEYVHTEQLPWPVGSDVAKQTVSAWKVNGYPSIYLIDRGGNLRVADVFRPHLEQAIELLLVEEIDLRAEPPQPERPNANQAVMEIQGSITGPDGKPLAGANVGVIGMKHAVVRGGDLDSFRSELFAETTTKADGRYQIAVNDLSSKSHQHVAVIASATGMAVAWEQLNPDNKAAEVSFELKPEATIKGRLIDIEGQPVAGVRMSVESVMVAVKDGDIYTPPRDGVGFHRFDKPPAAWVQTISSDEGGRFAILGVAAGHGVFLKVEGTDRIALQDVALNTGIPEQRGVRDGTYRALVKNVKPNEEAVLPLAPAQMFEGVVRYEDTGKPASQARLTIWASQQSDGGSMSSVAGKTDAQGRYRINPNPGVRFGVTAYPPDGDPYLTRRMPEVRWEGGETRKQVDALLPRGILVRGNVVESTTDSPVARASIQYVPESANNPNAKDDILTGWQGIQLSNDQGAFEIVVLPGPGRLLVHGPQGEFVLQEIPGRELIEGRAGGWRNYANAVERLEPAAGEDPIDVTIRLERAAKLIGRIVDEKGQPVSKALVISRLNIHPTNLTWRGGSESAPSTENGHFELGGLAPEQEITVYFLDPARQLGATATLKANGSSPMVVLKPCGQAVLKYVDGEGQPLAGHRPSIEMVVTPGPHRFESAANRRGKLAADADFVANIDLANYRPGPVADAEGRVTLPALIPGAIYTVLGPGENGVAVAKEFTVESGQTLDLGELVIDTESKTQSASKKTEIPAAKPHAVGNAITGNVVAHDGKPVPGAEVYWLSWSMRDARAEPLLVATTDEHGLFKFTAPAPPPVHNQANEKLDNQLLVFKAAGQGITLVRPHQLQQGAKPTSWLGQIASGLGRSANSHQAVTLPAADVPLRGHLVDIDGQPIAGAKVRVREMSDSLEQYRPRGQQASDGEQSVWQQRFMDMLQHFAPPQLPLVAPSATTDADGRFILAGIGRDQMVELLIEGDRIESTLILARTEVGEDIKITPNRNFSQDPAVVHAAEFTHVIGPSKPLTGRVLDLDTEEPIAGAVVRTYKIHGHPLHSSRERQYLASVTDAEGQFRIAGLPVGKENKLVAFTTGDEPYVPIGHGIDTSVAGDEIKQDFRLKRGVWAEGRVFDAKTKEPLTGKLNYYIFRDAELEKAVPGLRDAYVDELYFTNANGEFRVPVLAARGVLAFFYSGLKDVTAYPRGAGAESIEGAEQEQGSARLYPTMPHYLLADNYWKVVEVHPTADQQVVRADMPLSSGTTVTVRAESSTGVAVPDIDVFAAKFGWAQNRPSQFEVVGLQPGESRKVFVWQPLAKLAGGTSVNATMKEPAVITMEPSGSLRGRLVDEEGQPITDAAIEPDWGAVQTDPKIASWPYQPGRVELPTEVPVDKEGRFQIVGLASGWQYSGRITSPRKMQGRMMEMIVGQAFEGVTVERGEERDLGDIVVKQEQ